MPEPGLGPACCFRGSATGFIRLGPRPSIGRSLRFESMPYIVLEAAAASIPLIATRTGGIPEILPAAQLVAPGDPAPLARAIETVLGDIEAWQGHARTVAATVKERFSAMRMADSIAAFYAQTHHHD
ncbi:MAG TPA: glycosyltransferase [Aestuariivirgaceae bacterium]|nr:glycosyltransferase [Aestuariivirgaceae bacterium]